MRFGEVDLVSRTAERRGVGLPLLDRLGDAFAERLEVARFFGDAVRFALAATFSTAPTTFFVMRLAARFAFVTTPFALAMGDLAVAARRFGVRDEVEDVFRVDDFFAFWGIVGSSEGLNGRNALHLSHQKRFSELAQPHVAIHAAILGRSTHSRRSVLRRNRRDCGTYADACDKIARVTA